MGHGPVLVALTSATLQAAVGKPAAKVKVEKGNKPHAPAAARSARSQSVGSGAAIEPEKPQAGTFISELQAARPECKCCNLVG